MQRGDLSAIEVQRGGQAGQLVNHDEGADRRRVILFPVTRRSTSAVQAIGELQISGLGMDPAVWPNRRWPPRPARVAAHHDGQLLICQCDIDSAVGQQRGWRQFPAPEPIRHAGRRHRPMRRVG